MFSQSRLEIGRPTSGSLQPGEATGVDKIPGGGGAPDLYLPEGCTPIDS
jgi:hypothetical protein